MFTNIFKFYEVVSYIVEVVDDERMQCRDEAEQRREQC